MGRPGWLIHRSLMMANPRAPSPHSRSVACTQPTTPCARTMSSSPRIIIARKVAKQEARTPAAAGATAGAAHSELPNSDHHKVDYHESRVGHVLAACESEHRELHSNGPMRQGRVSGPTQPTQVTLGMLRHATPCYCQCNVGTVCATLLGCAKTASVFCRMSRIRLFFFDSMLLRKIRGDQTNVTVDDADAALIPNRLGRCACACIQIYAKRQLHDHGPIRDLSSRSRARARSLTSARPP